MVKLLILCFSGTGNAYFIGNYIKSRVELEEEEVRLEMIETFPLVEKINN